MDLDPSGSSRWVWHHAHSAQHGCRMSGTYCAPMTSDRRPRTLGDTANTTRPMCLAVGFLAALSKSIQPCTPEHFTVQ